MKIEVVEKQMGSFNKSYLIAEMACAHEGKPDLAHHLVEIAAESKVDAVQLQIFSVERLLSPLNPNYRDALHLEIPLVEWPQIISHARELGLEVWANVFDERALDLAMGEDVNVLKLHSSDISNPRMLDAVSSTEKPISLAVGGSTLDEISKAVWRLKENGSTDILLMHGYQGYPTTPEDAHLGFIRTLHRLFGCPVGYQDHTDGSSSLALILPLVAIGFGASVLEKHYTDDRSRRGTDYEAALEPDKLAQFVRMVRSVEDSIGDGTVQPMSPAELEYRKKMKKSVVAAHEIKAGEVVTENMLAFMRVKPPGLQPSAADRIVGKKSRHSIPQYTTFTLDDLQTTQDK